MMLFNDLGEIGKFSVYKDNAFTSTRYGSWKNVLRKFAKHD